MIGDTDAPEILSIRSTEATDDTDSISKRKTAVKKLSDLVASG